MFNSDFIVQLPLPALVVSLLIVLFSALFLYSRLFSSKLQTTRTILLTGTSGAGKTALFYKLTQNTPPLTVTSMAPNSADLTIANTNFRVLDFPGHSRLRPELLAILVRTPPRVVVLVVDGADRGRITDTAELLFDLFVSENLRSTVIIAVSKADAANFRAAGIVAAELEREIDALRKIREADGLFLGVLGENFKLAKHAPVSVRLCAFSTTEESGLKALVAALTKSLAN
jgi:signal recognition particle receptor subunit beta